MHDLGSAAAVIPAASLVTHHADTEWPFRQDSDFYYLCGFAEPGAVLALVPLLVLLLALMLITYFPVLSLWHLDL